jgi:hypothetical protein
LSGRLSSAGGQAEAVVHQHRLPRTVAVEHAAHLRDGDVALVDDDQGIARQVVDERGRGLPRRASREVARVVLDALAEAQLVHHLEVEVRPLLQALELEQLALALEPVEPLAQLHLDGLDRAQHRGARRHVVALGVEGEARDAMQQLPGQRIEQRERLDHVVVERDPQRLLRVLGREHVDRVPPDAKGAAAEIDVVAGVLHPGQARQQLALRHRILLPQHLAHVLVVAGIADAVDARHRRHDHGIVALEQALGRRQAHLLDVLVDRAVLLDVEVARGDVGLGLVVVVVGDEVLDRVLGEELAEFRVELRGERLVGRDHERGPAGLRDDVGHRVGLARARDPQQRLVGETVVQALDELLDRLGLVARRRERAMQAEGASGIGDDVHGSRREMRFVFAGKPRILQGKMGPTHTCFHPDPEIRNVARRPTPAGHQGIAHPRRLRQGRAPEGRGQGRDRHGRG